MTTAASLCALDKETPTSCSFRGCMLSRSVLLVLRDTPLEHTELGLLNIRLWKMLMNSIAIICDIFADAL